MKFSVQIYAHGISDAQRCVRIATRNIATKKEALKLFNFYKEAFRQGAISAWLDIIIAGQANSYYLSKRNINELFNLLK